MSPEWRLIDNPAWAGEEPSGLTESECHDRSHFVTVACACGEQMHYHETQLARVARKATIATRCKGCDEWLIFEPGQLRAAFAKMRKLGWIR